MDGAAKKASLDSLSKEELINRCKSLLQLAQKAKNAKDDLQTRLDSREDENKKNEEKMQELLTRIEECDDVIKAKQRQLDRSTEENDSLLQQMDTYCSQLKIVTKEKADLDKNHLKLQESLKKSEKQAMKAMELDASVICLRENEKLAQMKMKKLEEELNVEKKLNTSKDSEISKLTKLLEKAQDRLEEEKNKSFKETENEVDSKKVNELEIENNQLLEEMSSIRKEVELKNTELEKITLVLETSVANLDTMKNSVKERENTIASLRTELQENEQKDRDALEESRKELAEKENLLTQKKEEVDNLNTSMQNLESLNKELESKNCDILEDLNVINIEMKKRGEKLDRLEQINKEYGEKQKDLEKKIAENSLKTEKIQVFEATIAEKINYIEAINVENKQYKINIEENIRKIERLEKCLSEKDESLKNSQLELESLQLKNSEIQSLKLQLEEKTENNDENRIDLMTEINELKKEVEDSKYQKLEAEKKVTELNEQLVTRNQDISVELLEKNKIITEKELDIKQLTRNLEETKSTFEEKEQILSEEVGSLEKANQKLSDEIDEVKKQLKNKEEQLEDKSMEIEKLNNSVEECSLKLEEHGAIVAQFNDMKKQTEELNCQKLSFESQIAELNALLSASKQDVSNQLSEKNALIDDQCQEILKLKGAAKEKENLTMQMTENNAIIERQMKEIEWLKEAANETKNLSDLLKEKAFEAEKINAEFVVMQQKLDEAKVQIDKLSISSNELRVENEKTKEICDNKDVALKQLEEIKNSLEHEAQELKVAVNKLTAETVQLKKLNEDLKEELSDKNKSMNSSMNTTNHDMDDSRSEAMSTSTVSRVEEVNRMKDVEDSFEDRYTKLKLIAIKLKKKVADQDKVIKELDSKLKQANKASDDDTYSKEKISSLTKNFSILQAQYDEAVDKLETSNADLKTLKKDLEASIADNITNKQQKEEAVQQSLSAKTDQTKAEEKAREAEGKCHSLEVTLEQERKERKMLESSCKDNEGLTSKLKEKVDENTLIQETVNTLKLQVSQLEETLRKEQDRADTAQTQLSGARSQVTQLEADMTRTRMEREELVIKYEKSIQAHESLQEQLASNIQATDKSGSEKKNKIDQLERQVAALESSLQVKNQNIDSKEKELTQVKKDYENYKLRAQSVLKQSKEKVQEEDVKKKQEDIFALEKMNDALNDKLKNLSGELRTLTIERNGIQEEHDRLMSRHSVLMQESAAKERSWREKMEQKEILIKQKEHDNAGNIERIQKTLENLKQTHRQELELVKTNNTSEVSKLKQQLDTRENEVIRLELVLAKEQEGRRLAEELMGKAAESGNRFDNKLDIREIEREACEGQEVDIQGLGNSLTSPLPLDQLLAQSDLPDNISEEIRSTCTSRTGGVEKQLGHMAALLAESEAQNTRLEKLTEVLKEEIRTYQRSEERHKHIENLEYVKNVIMKFLTLTGTQEKSRLLPVLQTILKLKKEEVQLIEDFVRGEESSNKEGEGWSTYLGLWSGP